MLTPFSGIRTFMRSPITKQPTSEYTIIGVPTDMAVTFRSGARLGPAAIREASLMLVDGDHPELNVDPVGAGLVWDAGDIDPVINDPPATAQRIEQQLDAIVHPIMLGGDHSITLPALRSRFKRHGKMALLHFDAHVDTWEGSSNHGTFLREAINEGLVDPQHVVQLGIRSPSPLSIRQWGEQQGIITYTAQTIHNSLPNMRNLAQVISYKFPDTMPAYMTFDIDCLDPSVAPGTGTPEIGGLFAHQALTIINELAGKNWVGMDVVEVAPAYDPTGITAIAAATLAWNYICNHQSNRLRQNRGLR